MNGNDLLVLGGLFACAYMLQFYLSYLQMKNITKIYLKLVDEYKGEYFIGMNQKKKLGCNPVVILVSDKEHTIQEIYMLGGLLVTSRMKHVDIREEVRIDKLEEHRRSLKKEIGDKGFQALQSAANNILKVC